MINLFNTHIEALAIHRVGNKSRNETMFLSEELYRLTNEISPLIKEFFFKPFREKEENYFQFSHDVDLEYNELYNIATEIFRLNGYEDKFHEASKKITQHLFEQSNHPHIKSGEVYIAYLSNVSIDNNVVDAIGIFKSEIHNDFFEVNQKESRLEILPAMKRLYNITDQNNHTLVFLLKNNTLELSFQHDLQKFDAVEKLACDFEGEEIKIGFSANYLNNLLTAIEDDIVLELSTPILPCKITADNIRAILSPIRLN